MQGGGVNLDPVEGTRWLQLAANQGESESENNLGYSMMIRQDKDANLAEAAAWLILASRQGQSQAKVNLESLKTRLSSAVYQAAVQRADNFEPRPSPICNPMGTGLVPIVPFQESR
jgi:TPR repeat protein